MGIKTEDFVKNLPPKKMTEGVDWLGILDSFNPKSLNERFLNECARRNPWDTCYKWDSPSMPIKERLGHSEYGIRSDRQTLEEWVNRIKDEGLNTSNYKNTRIALIKAIGSLGAHEYNLREYASLGESGRIKQEEEYRKFEKEWQNKLEEKELEEKLDDKYMYSYEVSIHEKVARIRKGFKDSAGKPLTQRDFAKFLEYPINKYTEAEKTDKWGRNDDPESPVDNELMEKLIFRCHANPYWLYDSDCDAGYGHEDPNNEAVLCGDEPCIYATPDIILRWIKEGKSRDTYWIDGTSCR